MISSLIVLRLLSNITDPDPDAVCRHHEINVDGKCLCDTGYVGENCTDCRDNFNDVRGECYVTLGHNLANWTENSTLANTTLDSRDENEKCLTSVWWTPLQQSLLDCGRLFECVVNRVGLRIRCDHCIGPPKRGSQRYYKVGAAVYGADGRLHSAECTALTGPLEIREDKDFTVWVEFPPGECFLATSSGALGDIGLYLAFWSTMALEVYWEEVTAGESTRRVSAFTPPIDRLPLQAKELQVQANESKRWGGKHYRLVSQIMVRGVPMMTTLTTTGTIVTMTTLTTTGSTIRIEKSCGGRWDNISKWFVSTEAKFQNTSWTVTGDYFFPTVGGLQTCKFLESALPRVAISVHTNQINSRTTAGSCYYRKTTSWLTFHLTSRNNIKEWVVGLEKLQISMHWIGDTTNNIRSGVCVGTTNDWKQENEKTFTTEVGVTHCNFTLTPVYATTFIMTPEWRHALFTQRINVEKGGFTFKLDSMLLKSHRLYKSNHNLAWIRKTSYGFKHLALDWIGDSRGSTQKREGICVGRQAGGWHNGTAGTVSMKVSTAACEFEDAPILVTSLDGACFVCDGQHAPYQSNASGFRSYITGDKEVTANDAQEKDWAVAWMARAKTQRPW